MLLPAARSLRQCSKVTELFSSQWGMNRSQEAPTGHYVLDKHSRHYKPWAMSEDKQQFILAAPPASGPCQSPAVGEHWGTALLPSGNGAFLSLLGTNTSVQCCSHWGATGMRHIFPYPPSLVHLSTALREPGERKLSCTSFLSAENLIFWPC